MDLVLYLWLSLAAITGVLMLLSFMGSRYAQLGLWVLGALVSVFLPFTNSVKVGNAIPFVLILAAGVCYLIWGYSRKDLEDAQDEIRRLHAESNRRTEAERQRIAHILHDDVNPQIVMAKMELQAVESMFAGIENDELRDNLGCAIKTIVERLSKAYNLSREVIRQTRVEVIDSIGFIAATESMVGNYKNILDTPRVELHHDLGKRLDLPRETAANVYRIIQEAVFNAVKHAGATKIRVEMKKAGKRVAVEIRDDGKGIQPVRSDGVGLIDMRERANLLGEKIKIERMSSGGTRVTFGFSVPVSSNQT